MELKGIQYLKNKLTLKRSRALLRYGFYEMKNVTLDFGISSPPDLRNWNSVVGWCAKGVDTLADRLDFYGFRDDIFDLTQIYDLNNRDTLIDSLILGALITSCNFVSISEDESGFPRLEVVDGTNATGIIDPRTGLLTEGYAVLERDEYTNILREAYYTADWTAYYERGRLTETYTNPAPYPLLVPVIFRPDAVRPFGHSRISRACMSLAGSALRTIKRSEIAAEFYSYPQKWITGIDQDIQTAEKWKATMAAMMYFTENDDGQNNVKVGQFTQGSMEPHVVQLRMFASLFAGEVGLTLDDLGIATENPSSADAIKASHENLRLTARAAHKSFGTGLLNAGYLASCVRDNYAYQRQQLYMTKPVWYPAFPADASMLGAIGDAIGKFSQSMPDYIDEDKVFELTGI